MSTDGIANYGARQPDISQNIKQFLPGANSQAIWVYKKLIPGSAGLPSGTQVQTPANSNVPVYINNDMYVNGSIYANAFTNISDERLKDNISSIREEEIQDFHLLEPKTFNYKENDLHEKHYGFIAQEVEKIFPQLVKDNITGYKTINYIEMIPLLVIKINEMQKEIDEMQKEIDELKKSTI